MRILTAEEIEHIVYHETERSLKTLRGKRVPRVYGEEIARLQRLRMALHYMQTLSIETATVEEETQ